MDLNILIDPKNPDMAMVWAFAHDHYTMHSRRTKKEYKDIISVEVEDVCEALTTLLRRQGRGLRGQTFYRTSMVVDGIRKIHNMQTELLLDDTIKLLRTMRREKKAMKTLDDNIDCLAKGGIPKGIELDFEQINLEAQDVSISTLTAARLKKMDWTTLDHQIDFTAGPPRARLQEITLPSEDVPYSTEYVTELERLRAMEGTFEGPNLLDWEEEISRESSPKPDEQRADQSLPEALLDTEAPAPVAEELPVPQIVVEEPSGILPPILDEPVPPAAPEPEATPQPPEEPPSQIELAPLEEDQRQARRQRKVKPLTDYITHLSNDTIKMQIQSHRDTMRNQNVSEDIVNLNIQKYHEADVFNLRPIHRRVMADALLELFRPCETEAEFPDEEASLDIARGTSQIEEQELSSVLSLFQDTSGSLQRSRSTLAQFDEAPLPPLESIEEHGVAAPLPPPSEGEVPSAAKEKEPQKPKKPRKAKEPDVDKTPATRDAAAAKQTTLDDFGFETGREELPILEREESSELSEPHDQSLTDPEMLMREVLEFLAAHHEVFLNSLLPEDATDMDAGYLFEHLLQMHKDRKVKLSQEQTFGPIKIELDEAAEP